MKLSKNLINFVNFCIWNTEYLYSVIFISIVRVHIYFSNRNSSALNIDFNETAVFVKPNVESEKCADYFFKNVANDSAGLAFPGDLYRRKLHLVACIPQLALHTISIMYIAVCYARTMFFIVNLIKAKAEKRDYCTSHFV